MEQDLLLTLTTGRYGRIISYMDTVQLNIPIPADLHRDLKLEAVRQKQTLRKLVVYLLEMAVNPPEPTFDEGAPN